MAKQYEEMSINKRRRRFDETTSDYVDNFFDDFRFRETESLECSEFDTLSLMSSDTELYEDSSDNKTVSPENVIKTPPRLIMTKIKKD